MAATEAAAILQQRDPQLGVLIARLGEDTWPDRNPPDSLLAALARAVLAQQIAPKAAETIYQRFLGLFPQASPSAEALLALPEATLRGAGISRPKVSYLKALARAELPSWAALEAMEDEAIVPSLTAVKGVGRWTVEMLLIFELQREDVWPAEDLGLAKALQQLYGWQARPNRQQVRACGERWCPYRSTAARYLWRSLA